jgi:hypothetical protein
MSQALKNNKCGISIKPRAQLSAPVMSLPQMDGHRRPISHGRLNNLGAGMRNLGFMGPDTEIPILGEHDEEDALLCEMMDNARKPEPLFVLTCNIGSLIFS